MNFFIEAQPPGPDEQDHKPGPVVQTSKENLITVHVYELAGNLVLIDADRPHNFGDRTPDLVCNGIISSLPEHGYRVLSRQQIKERIDERVREHNPSAITYDGYGAQALALELLVGRKVAAAPGAPENAPIGVLLPFFSERDGTTWKQGPQDFVACDAKMATSAEEDEADCLEPAYTSSDGAHLCWKHLKGLRENFSVQYEDAI